MNAAADNRVYFEISLALPWLLRLPDSVLRCKVGRSEYLLVTKAHVTEIGASKGDHPGISFGLNGTLAAAKGADVPGAMLRFTEVLLKFSKRLHTDLVRPEESRRAAKAAHKFLNYFLDMYRFTTRDPDVRPLTSLEFHDFRAGRGLLLKSNVVRAGGKCESAVGVIMHEQDPVVLGTSPVLPKPEFNDLRRHLEHGDIPRLSSLLILNAAMHIRASQTRFAVIDMNSALDIIVEEKAKIWLIHNGCSASEAESQLERRNTRAIMQDVLLPTIKVPADDQFPWDQWCAECRDLRNRVVHDAYEPTLEEAQRSYDTIEQLCRFLSSSPEGDIHERGTETSA